MPVIKSKVASHILKSTPERVESLNSSVGIVNKIIKSDLKLIKKKKISSPNAETCFLA